MKNKTTFYLIKSTSFVLIFCALAFIAEAQTVSIQQQGDYAVGPSIFTPRFTVGDVNNDRLPDLVTLNPGNLSTIGPISVFLNNGAGGFGTAFEMSVAVPTSNNEMQIAAIDANIDGKDDLVIGRQGGFLLYHGNSALFTRTENDFDGDLKSDLSVIRPSNGTWYVNRSTQGFFAHQWGLANDKLTPADYDSDGKTDFAIFRPSNSIWYIFNSATGTATYRQWGTTTDALTPGDYNGDGKTEVSVYRASEQNWYVPQCADYKQSITKFGASSDVAVPSSLIP